MHIFLTGATGLVGQYLVRDLLLAGASLAVLIRPSGNLSAGQRLEQLMARWEQTLSRPLPRPVCLEGDVSQPGLGLTAEARTWVGRHCEALLHNAASVTFDGKDRAGEPWLSNLTGVRNVLDFCRQTGPRQLLHVSTAYVCGQRRGPIYEEDLECGQAFRNDYERSKFEGECAIRAADFLDQTTVVRPAIIVGDSCTGFTSTYHGLYPYIQFAWLLVSHLERGPNGRVHLDLRLDLTGEERRNLVPVDWVAAVISHLMLHPAHHGRTYHLTPTQPVTARQLEESMAAYFQYEGPVFAGPDVTRERNELEKLFHEHVAHYAGYWVEEPIFDCRHTQQAAPHLPCPPLDADCLRRLIDFAVQDRWGKGPPKARATPRKRGNG